jgi:hypothetical protein
LPADVQQLADRCTPTNNQIDKTFPLKRPARFR